MHLRDWDSVHHISRIGCDGVVNITTSNLLPEQFRPLSKISYNRLVGRGEGGDSFVRAFEGSFFGVGFGLAVVVTRRHGTMVT